MKYETIQESFYEAILQKDYPDRLILINEEEKIYQKAKQYIQLNDDEKEIFEFFAEVVKKFYATTNNENVD